MNFAKEAMKRERVIIRGTDAKYGKFLYSVKNFFLYNNFFAGIVKTSLLIQNLLNIKTVLNIIIFFCKHAFGLGYC